MNFMICYVKIHKYFIGFSTVSSVEAALFCLPKFAFQMSLGTIAVEMFTDVVGIGYQPHTGISRKLYFQKFKRFNISL